MTTQFSQKLTELQSKATKLPWTWHGKETVLIAQKGPEHTITEMDSEYIVFAVNNIGKVTELLLEVLEKLDLQGFNAGNDADRIRARLDELK